MEYAQDRSLDLFSRRPRFGDLFHPVLRVGATAADLLNDRVLPFFAERGMGVLRIHQKLCELVEKEKTVDGSRIGDL